MTNCYVRLVAEKLFFSKKKTLQREFWCIKLGTSRIFSVDCNSIILNRVPPGFFINPFFGFSFFSCVCVCGDKNKGRKR